MVEGFARILSPEWIRTTATVLPVLVALGWCLRGTSALWRRSVWRAAGDQIRRVQAATDGDVRPALLGWVVQSRDLRVCWKGGLAGPATVIRRGAVRIREAGWLTAQEVLTGGSSEEVQSPASGHAGSGEHE